MKFNEDTHSENLVPEKAGQAFDSLMERMNNHPFWRCRLLFAISAKHLSFNDYQVLFSEYFHYSKNFTRYLSGLLINLENDLLRSKLTENLGKRVEELNLKSVMLNSLETFSKMDWTLI